MEGPMENPKNTPKLPVDAGEKAGPKVIQRWSAARKREIVIRLLRGESLEVVSREIGVEPYRLERWRDKALAAMDVGRWHPSLRSEAHNSDQPPRNPSPVSKVLVAVQQN
jgi:transposase-like protein